MSNQYKDKKNLKEKEKGSTKKKKKNTLKQY